MGTVLTDVENSFFNILLSLPVIISISKRSLMKFLLPLLPLLFFLSSCQTYQYLSIDSNTVQRDSAKQFIVETDSLTIQYNFGGYNGPIRLTVHNKSDQPIFVDWKKSAMIIQGKAYSYYSPNQQLTGSTLTDEVSWRNGVTIGSGSITAEIRSQEGVEFIPPKSKKEHVSLYLLSGYLGTVPEEKMAKQHPDGNQDLPRLKTIHYTPGNSPFQMRSYLTLYAGSMEAKPFALEHPFYVSAIRKGPVPPNSLPLYQNRGDIFYTSKLSDAGKTLGTAVGLGILGGLVVVAASGDH
jgi:hypothetical protein